MLHYVLVCMETKFWIILFEQVNKISLFKKCFCLKNVAKLLLRSQSKFLIKCEKSNKLFTTPCFNFLDIGFLMPWRNIVFLMPRRNIVFLMPWRNFNTWVFSFTKLNVNLSFNPFPHIDAFWRLCSRQLFENIVTKEEIAQNMQFLFLPQCFRL